MEEKATERASYIELALQKHRMAPLAVGTPLETRRYALAQQGAGGRYGDTQNKSET